ncbi:MAG: response regulator [Phycisphaerae bacterium]
MNNTSSKTVLTTGDVARICSVAPRTVSKWFDSGQLQGYRIPGSKDRRIPLDQLIRFMRANNMPLDALDVGQTCVVIVEADLNYGQSLSHALGDRHGYDVFLASSVIEAGGYIAEQHPDALVIDTNLPDVVPQLISRWVRSLPELQRIKLIGTGHAMSEAMGQELLQHGFDDYLSKPFDVDLLVNRLQAGRHL